MGTINYDPRAIPQTSGPALLTPSPPAPTPQPSVTYLPPVPPQPSKSYSVPDRSQYQAPPNNYDSRQYHDTTPLINYQPRPAVDSYANYLGPDIYTPSSIERHDIPDEEVITKAWTVKCLWWTTGQCIRDTLDGP